MGFVKIVSWNVSGLRARVEAGFVDCCGSLDADIICLQETRCLRHEVPPLLPNYYVYINPALQRGYSGTALLTRTPPLKVSFSIPRLRDIEGRYIIAEFPRFILVNVYTPLSQKKLARLTYRELWDEEFLRACVEMDKKKPVIIAGDLNVAHLMIDDQFPTNRTRVAGFTWIERYGFKKLLENGFTDSYKFIHSSVSKQRTYWKRYGDPMSEHMGWRHDYILVSSQLRLSIMDATVERFIGTSDHCPVTMKMYLHDR